MTKYLLLLAITFAAVTGQPSGPIVPWPLNRDAIASNELPGTWMARGRNSALCLAIATPNPRSISSSLFVQMMDGNNFRASGWATSMERTFTGTALDASQRIYAFAIFKVNRKIYMRLRMPNSKENRDFELQKSSRCLLR